MDRKSVSGDSRRSIPVNEVSQTKKYCNTIEKIIKDIDKVSKNKLKLLKADVDFGEEDESKVGKLDELFIQLDKCYNMLIKL